MQDVLRFDDKTLYSIRHAATEVSYSKDYITKLAREKKIYARWVGRQWFVDLDSVRAYESSAQLEQTLRKQRLSEERKREHELRLAAAAHANNLSTAQIAHPLRAMLSVGVVALLGVVLGTGSLVGYEHFAQLSSTPGAASLAAVAPVTPVTPVISATAAVGTELLAAVTVPVAASSSLATTTGVLLLPDIAGEVAPEILFSDVITTRSSDDGSLVLIARDPNTGEAETMPFVVVPVTTGETFPVRDSIYE